MVLITAYKEQKEYQNNFVSQKHLSMPFLSLYFFFSINKIAFKQ